MHEVSEEWLVVEVNGRTPESYKALHARFFRYLFVTSMYITDNEAESEDIVNTVFIKLYTQMPKARFQSLEHLRRLLLKMVRRAGFSYRKRAEGRKTIEFREEWYPNEQDPDTMMDALEHRFRETLWELKHDRVSKLLATIEARSIIVLRLYYLEEKSTREIAQLLGIANQTALNLLSQGRKKVSNALKEEKWLLSILLVIFSLSII